MHIHKIFQLALAIGATVFFSGCATVVYKDGASTFVSAGRVLTKQLNDSNASLGASQDALKLNAIVSDPSCPVEQSRVFVRQKPNIPASYEENRRALNTALARYPSTATSDSCSALLACRSSGDASCKSACLSAREGNCLENLETNYALDQQHATGTGDKQLNEEVKRFALILDTTEYGRTASVENRLITGSFEVLTEYIDLLGKVTEERKTEIPAATANLAKTIKKANDDLKNLSKGRITPASDAQLDRINKGSTVLGKFYGDIDLMVQQSDDVEKIKKLAIQYQDTIPLIISIIQPVFGADAKLVAVFKERSEEKVLLELAGRYKVASTDYERRQLMMERAKIVDGRSKTDLENSVAKVFDALFKAHANMVQLIMNPDKEQLKKIRSEQFNTFVTLVQDAVAVLELVK